MVRIQIMLLRAVEEILLSLLETRQNEIARIQESKDDFHYKTNPSVWAVQELTMGRFATQVKSLRRTIRVIGYYREQLGQQGG